MEQARIDIARRADGELELRMSGAWKIDAARPAPADVEREIAAATTKRVRVDARDIAAWDSMLVAFVARLIATCKVHAIELDKSGLPTGVQRLLALAEAVPEENAAPIGRPPSGFARIGGWAVERWNLVHELLEFLGQVAAACGRAVRMRARFRRSDFALFVQQCGAEALPIVTLISVVVGSIVAFVGAVRLRQFGADSYVADMVGIAMVREFGSMMCGIVLAGRTGAAFAAQLGTMKVTGEIDALTTFGIRPIEFLVLPRMLALFLMMPLLCLYAALLGICGGAIVGVSMLGIAPWTYFQETADAVSMADLSGGLIRGAIYGLIIAVVGCLRGMQCGNSASAVGEAATRAVVASIVAIIVADGILAILSNVVGR
jgi:phospholipid/cholesterol/gamma-HCH transport system permease protein